MKKILPLFLSVALSGLPLLSLAGTDIDCYARYQYQVYHEPVQPAYSYGRYIGSQPIHGTGRAGYYETKWSNNYRMTVSFFSGYELNEIYNRQYYSSSAIVAIVNWSDGGSSTIILAGWSTRTQYLNKEDLAFDAQGRRIALLTGYDEQNRFWEFRL